MTTVAQLYILPYNTLSQTPPLVLVRTRGNNHEIGRCRQLTRVKRSNPTTTTRLLKSWRRKRSVNCLCIITRAYCTRTGGGMCCYDGELLNGEMQAPHQIQMSLHDLDALQGTERDKCSTVHAIILRAQPRPRKYNLGTPVPFSR